MLKSVKTRKLVFLGGIFPNAPSSDFDEIFFIRQPYISTNPLYTNDIGVQPY